MTESQLYRDLADAIDYEARVVGWINDCAASVSRIYVSWEVGSAVGGYGEVRALVAEHLGTTLPAVFAAAAAAAQARVLAARQAVEDAALPVAVKAVPA